MNGFTYDALPGRIVFGLGSSRTRLQGEVERLKSQRLLVIASRRDSALAIELTAPFADRVAGAFTNVRVHVPIEVAEAARSTARELQADAILALGGGSAIGAAKAIALENPLPIIAVPSTYSGSEMTPIYGLTSGQRKQTGRSPNVLPRVVIYDPELTFGLPAQISGPSAINALAHCVEAFYGPGANPVTDLMAEEGIRALVAGVPAVVAQPTDVEGRSKTLYGAYLAGAALAAAGTGLHHKICHILGGAYNLPHADLHTVILPHAVAYLTPAIPAAMARIATALQSNNAATAIYDLAARIGAPIALSAIGMPGDQLDTAAALLVEHLPVDLPRTLDIDSAKVLIADAYHGRRP
ncbi:MAG: maleylacetate reductase [Oscillochloris sp.]|nr:maleylacetate reductase [Oscillochloris sp.]